MLRRSDVKARAGASPAPTMTRAGRSVRVMVGVPLAGTLATMTRLGSPVRIMVGVPLAGTLARDCIPKCHSPAEPFLVARRGSPAYPHGRPSRPTPHPPSRPRFTQVGFLEAGPGAQPLAGVWGRPPSLSLLRRRRRRAEKNLPLLSRPRPYGTLACVLG